MYIGIDLGTSNSAIVGSDTNGLRLFKTDDGRDVLPSMIYFDRRGHMMIGSRAHAQAELSPGNVAQGFKRLMGTSSSIDLAAAAKSISPEEASAEILKTLLRQVEAELGPVQITGAIITIPAAFNQMQSEATIKAAHMAGLNEVGLLQEPIAAAMAALEGVSRRDGRFLVYDLGGGTFDVALVEATSGSVTVIAHEGINMLGGRDFDRVIVDSVIRPWLDTQFSLPSNVATLPAYKRLFAVARLKAEQAKIELSTKAETVIFLSDEDVRAEDNNGEPIFVECSLNRDTLEGLIHAGSPVNIHWRMDDNGLIACDLEFPDIGLNIQQKNFYVPDVGHRSFDGEEGAELARAQLESAREALLETQEALQQKNAPEISTLSRRLNRMDELLENSGDAEARRAATEEALHIQQELARLRDAPGNRHAVMLRDIQAFEDSVSDLVENLDRATVERLNQLGHSAREAIGREDWAKARQIIEQMYSTFYNSLYEQPEFILGMFAELAGERYAALDKDLHDSIVERGLLCADNGDIDGVRAAVRDILNNRMPSQSGAKKVAVLSGLLA